MNNPEIGNLQKFSDKYVNSVIACLILLAWLVANLMPLQWLVDSIIQTSWFNRILIISVILALTTWAIIKNKIHNFSAPIVTAPPLLLMVSTAIASVALQWTIELPQITALLFLLGSYGLCGLFLEPLMWRRGLAIAGTVSIVLPFSLQFTSGLGLAARVLTAQVVEKILDFWHITAISSYDIIILENGIATVDLPCSGLRSLWTGTLFLLGATWLEGRMLGFRWLLVYAASMLLLITANVGRVLLLTITTFVLKQPIVADIIHIPLGFMGFIGACTLTWFALKLVPLVTKLEPQKLPNPELSSFESDKIFGLNRNHLLLISVLAGIMILANMPRLNLKFDNTLTPIQLPVEIQTQPLALTTNESDFFANNAIATKHRFQFGNLTGSMLLVSSSSWRSHHSPEVCLLGNGLKVDGMASKQLKTSFPVRWLTLENGKMSAMYWFQSPTQTTDQLLARIWSEISYSDRTWSMVSILFDRVQTTENSEVQTFANLIRDSLYAKT